MDKSYKLLLGVVTLVLVGLAGLYLYLRSGKQMKPSSTTLQPPVAETPLTDQAEIGPQNEETTVTIGSQGVSRGSFDKVESGEIYFRGTSGITKLPLTIDEVVLACTDQDFADATELDFDQITKINIYNNQTIGDNLEVGDTIVVFATDVEGTLRAHTIALNNSSSSCK